MPGTELFAKESEMGHAALVLSVLLGDNYIIGIRLVKKMWYMYTMEDYSAIKKSGIMLFAGKWMALGIIMLSEISQAQKDKCHTFSLICGVQTQ
jgi:hypothetical protein